MKKRKKKNKNKFIIILTISIVVVLIIIGVHYYYNDQLGRELSNKGYKTDNTDNLYFNKIVTNNTLDNFYADVANNIESAYEEYYFTKESYDFIELKMNYKNGVLYTLNITSDLKRNITTYNYEVSNDEARLILEGNNTEEYACRIVKKENISNDTLENHCKYIKNEVNTFLTLKEEFINNNKIMEIINKE